MIDLGDLYQVAVDIRDAAGLLTNPSTAVLTITLPDGTTTTPTVPLPPTEIGKLRVDYLTAQAGRHLARMVTTGPNTAHTDAFTVRPANPAMLISLAEAKAHLGEQSTLQDEEIRTYIEVATEIVEGIVGPCIVRDNQTRRIRSSNGYQLLLNEMPVISVTSVISIPYPSTAYASADLDVDTEAGIISLLSGGVFANGPWTVVYKSGRTSVPARSVEAVKDLLWHMWVFQRGQTADSITPDLADVTDFEARGSFVSGFLVPHYVREKLERDTIPGFA